MNLREKTLEIARSYLGTSEQGGNNRGEQVEEFLRAAKCRPGDPWCAAFVNWCAEKGAQAHNVISPLESVPLQGYVQSYFAWAREHGYVVTVEQALPGDLFCLYYGNLGRYGHIGFVESVDTKRGVFKTVEGNSNSAGTRESFGGRDGVVSNTRKLTGNVVFLRWTRKVVPRG